jgi:hypothetical protein
MDTTHDQVADRFAEPLEALADADPGDAPLAAEALAATLEAELEAPESPSPDEAAEEAH